jgi:hypothetical protein
VVWDCATGLPRGYLDVSTRGIALSPVNSRLSRLAAYRIKTKKAREVPKGHVLWGRSQGKSSGFISALGFSPAGALPVLIQSDGHRLPKSWEPVLGDSLIIRILCNGCLGPEETIVLLFSIMPSGPFSKSVLIGRTLASMLPARLLRSAGCCCSGM